MSSKKNIVASYDNRTIISTGKYFGVGSFLILFVLETKEAPLL